MIKLGTLIVTFSVYSPETNLITSPSLAAFNASAIVSKWPSPLVPSTNKQSSFHSALRTIFPLVPAFTESTLTPSKYHPAKIYPSRSIVGRTSIPSSLS